MFQCLNPGMISLSLPFDEALLAAASAGFSGLDLPDLRQLVQQYSIVEIKERFAEAGLRPGGWGLPVEFRKGEDVYQQGLALFPAYAKLAQELGSPWCSTWILPISDTVDYEANMALHVRRLKPVARILADHGCRLGLEFVGPASFRVGKRYEFIHTIDGALTLGERIGTGNTGLLLDSFHWYTSHAAREDLARLNAEQVVSVHVNDAPGARKIDEQIDGERLLPGASGVIDIAAFLQELQRMNYQGPVVVEPFNKALSTRPTAERVHAVKRSLEKIWQQAGLA